MRKVLIIMAVLVFGANLFAGGNIKKFTHSKMSENEAVELAKRFFNENVYVTNSQGEMLYFKKIKYKDLISELNDIWVDVFVSRYGTQVVYISGDKMYNGKKVKVRLSKDFMENSYFYNISPTNKFTKITQRDKQERPHFI